MCLTPSTWNVWLHWCTGSPPFHTFYSHALGCVGMRCHSPYYWKLLEPPGTPRILLDVPHPQYLKCMAALVCRSPPLSYILFPCSGLCWHALPFSVLLNYWNHLELLGFSWMCPTPSKRDVWLHWCAGPSPFHTFYSHALGYVGMRCHSPYYWKLLEPPATPRILLDVPCPPVLEMHGCTDVQVPPFHTWQTEKPQLVLGSW